MHCRQVRGPAPQTGAEHHTHEEHHKHCTRVISRAAYFSARAAPRFCDAPRVCDAPRIACPSTAQIDRPQRQPADSPAVCRCDGTHPRRLVACTADMLRHACRALAFRHPAFVSTCGCLGSLQLSAEAGDVFACLLVRQLLQLLGCLYSSDTVCAYVMRVCVSQHTPCNIFTYIHTYTYAVRV